MICFTYLQKNLGFMFSPYNFNGYPGCGPMMGSIYVPPEALDYLDVCKRAQLKAILSQVNPNLTPRLRKANTKEFGVQVNAQVDAMVQCSLGPKTLFYRERKFPFFSKSPVTCQRSPSATSSLDGKALPSTPVNNVRFSRPLAIYSPVFDRRFFALPVKTQDDSACCEGGEGGGNGGSDEDGEADVTEQKTEDQVTPEIPREDVREPLHQMPKGFNFQFLEQKYGFFHCSQCNVRWESAYVWCISGTSKVTLTITALLCQLNFKVLVNKPSCALLSLFTFALRSLSRQ
uniref:Zygote arrest 1-like n=1 Tax=Hucho hucho TaxID=62062 RepID=A0A4W5LRQ4_9TELE